MKQRIGNRLLSITESKQLTQAEMAHLLDVPLTTYCHYERNETSVEYHKLVKFAEKLNISIQELLPENVIINNSNSGQGGSVVFGNQIVYVGNDVINQSLAEENKMLKEKLSNIEQKMEELLGKITK